MRDARAVLNAIREPSEAMKSAGEGSELQESYDTTADYTHAYIDEAVAGNVWQAMIDAALEEG